MSKKIAIFGGVHHEADSAMVLMVQLLAEDLAKAGHQIIACGGQGVPLAVAQGAHRANVLKPMVFTDIGDASQVPHGEAVEDSHFINLNKVLRWPEIYIFFSGRAGTFLQLSHLMMMLHRGLLPDNPDRKVIIYTPEADDMMWLLTSFFEMSHIYDRPDCIHKVDSVAKIMKLI